MKNFMSAMALALVLAAVPSFAQYEDDYYQDNAPAPVAVQQKSSSSNSYFFPSDFKSYIRMGGRIAIGFGGAGEWTGVNADLGGSLRYYFSPVLAIAPEINIALRTLSDTYAEESYYYRGDRYKAEWEESYNQILLDVPVLARFEPLPFLYVESGLKLGVELTSFYSRDYVLRDPYNNERLDNVNLDLDEWHTYPFYASFVFGAGGNVRSSGQDIDVGIRVILDLNDLDHANGDNHWSVQLSMTYLL